MIVTGWSNGSPTAEGAGYGIRIPRGERDAHFRKTWPSVIVELEGGEDVEIVLSPSFWRGCSELRSAAVGKLMIGHGLAPWRKKRPPTIEFRPLGDRRFRLEAASHRQRRR